MECDNTLGQQCTGHRVVLLQLIYLPLDDVVPGELWELDVAFLVSSGHLNTADSIQIY